MVKTTWMLLLCLSTCLIHSATAIAGDTYRIGVSLGLTGKYAQPARMHEMAYRLWEKELNAEGGINGRKVIVDIRNDESSTKVAQDIYGKLILKERVDLVFGPYSSAITQAVAPIVDKHGYPMLAAGAASDSIWQKGYRNILGMDAPASRYSAGILDLAYSNGLERVAIVYADDAFSTEVAEGAKKWATPYQLRVVMFESFKKGTKDLRPLARKAQEARADLLILGGHFDEAVGMRRALSRIGWDPRAFFATVGPAMARYGEVMGAEADLTFAASVWEPTSKLPGSREFADAFRSAYSEEPSYQAAMAYATGQILEAAIELAGSLERGPIRQAMFDLDTYSIIGRYAVDRTGLQMKNFPLTIQWQKGKKEIVWREEEQSTKPIIR